MSETFKRGEKVYCLGIGGIGLSAAAQWLFEIGVVVTGSDMVDSDTVKMLRDKGVFVDISKDIKEIPLDTNVLVYSDAVPPEHSVRKFARVNGIKEMSYAQCLGVLTDGHQCIAIAGSHGKSTTTALVASILIEAGIDPTVVVGTKIPAMGNSNFRLGKSSIVVVEADEYKNHFLELNPTVAIITNVDYDHVDAFPTKESYLEAFEKFVGKIKGGGTLIVHNDDSNTENLLSVRDDLKKIVFGFLNGKNSGNNENITEYFADKLKNTSPDFAQVFSLVISGKDCGNFSVSFPGDHFLLDALAAIAAVSFCNVNNDVIQKTLESFEGTWRRFELVGELRGAPVISDYAHHPTELAALLQGTRQVYQGKKISIVFQPHHGARTIAFEKEFISALRGADEVIVVDLYGVAGRENNDGGISVEKWVNELRSLSVSAEFARDLDAAENILRNENVKRDVILCVGAGSIDQLARRISVKDLVQIEENVPLSKYCTWHVGGSARYFVKVKEIEELRAALNWAKNKNVGFFILGGGSNVLFNDAGFSGLVIRMDCRKISITEKELCAEAGAIMRVAVLRAAEEGLGGIEHLAGIPGTIGGMVRGNAGALGMETKDNLLRVKVLHRKENEWQVEVIDRKDIFFSYRDSTFKREKENYVIWEVFFGLNKSNKAEIVKLIDEDLKVRKERQPYDFPSAGSVFKNPNPERSAGRVIEESGCKGMNIGGAWVSEKHANFIVNKGGATSADIKNLIEKIKKQVLEKTGIDLEEEIVIVKEK